MLLYGSRSKERRLRHLLHITLYHTTPRFPIPVHPLALSLILKLGAVASGLYHFPYRTLHIVLLCT